MFLLKILANKRTVEKIILLDVFITVGNFRSCWTCMGHYGYQLVINLKDDLIHKKQL